MQRFEVAGRLRLLQPWILEWRNGLEMCVGGTTKMCGVQYLPLKQSKLTEDGSWCRGVPAQVLAVVWFFHIW